MTFTVSVLIGIVLGVALMLATSSLKPAGSQAPSPAAWVAIVTGALGVAAVAVGFTPLRMAMPWAVEASIALPVAGLIVAVTRVAKHERHWPVWTGLSLNALPALFWVAFLFGELLGPAH